MDYRTRSFRHLQVDLTDAVLTITLDHPEVKNALTVPMMEDLRLLLDCARVDPDVRAVMLTGTGTVFSAGGNVKAMAEGRAGADHPLNRPAWNIPTLSAADRLRKIPLTGLEVMRTLAAFEKPTLAAINGDAVAAGLDLALACDLRLAADSARLGCTYSRIGLIPFDGSMYWLPRLVGLARAFELMYLGDLISSTEAERIGLVNRVVPAAELATAAREMVRRLARGPMVAYSLTKHLTQRSLSLDFGASLDLAYEALGIVYTTEDHENAVAAFLEKRPPEFRGR